MPASQRERQPHNRHTTYGSDEESPSNSDGSPGHTGTASNEKPGKWAKTERTRLRATALRFSSTSLAHLKRGITERKWVEARS